jgi:ankyrin repeat protein
VENIFCPVDHLHLLISHGADINFQDFNGDTLLHYACKGHSIKTEQILDAMLRLQVDVNLQNILGQTCLHLYRYSSSPSSQNREKAHSIIDAGANLELYDRNGMTVLLNGVAKQNWAMVDVLLQHPKRPSISARTFLNGKTALHLACQSRSPVEFVEKLVSHGADPKWIDNDGNTLLHETAARFEGYPEEIALVEKLVEMGVPIDARNSRRQTAAHVVAPVYADSHNSIESATRQSFISVLLRLDPRFDVNAQDIDGYTPLHFASAASESQTFNLLRAGANLNAKSFNLRTPLHCAARARQSSIIAMLLHFATESGRQIDVNAADVDGRTPLHDASRSGRPESVRLLIDTGANLQQQDKTSTTPLMACAEFVNEDKLWSCMRNRTGSTDLTIQDDFRPMRITRERNQRFRADEHTQHDTARVGVIAKMLIKAGASIDGALHKALSAKSAELVAAIRQEAKEWESDEARSFAETSLMLSIRNATSVLDSCNGYGPVNNAVSFIPDIDEATMEALLSRGVDFTKGDSSAVDGTAITKIARLGLTEYMSKIISQAKLLDDPAFTKNITEAVQTGYYKIRPLLQVACDRPLWNMDMVRLLVAEGQVNVNAHQPVKETKNHSETGNVIPGPTALHVLAKGDFWWQVDAIKFLVNNGTSPVRIAFPILTLFVTSSAMLFPH